MRKEALYYEKRDKGRVRCRLCPHQCLINSGKSGFCRVRRNVGGRLEATTYGLVTAAGMDPIEKKPLYHFHPGSMIFSLGQAGCTFHCDFCQNCRLLSPDIPQQELSPEDAVGAAVENHSTSIAYTYNEPWAGYEYVLDTASAAHRAGLNNVLVTNGYCMQEPFDNLAPFIDAMNVDLKSMREEFYRTRTRGELEPVRRTIEDALRAGIHLEITNLLITGLNDSPQDVRALVAYVAELGRDVPLHIARYHPAYKMDRPPTPPGTLLQAYEIAAEALDYVYLGNVTGIGGADSACPGCGSLLVRRGGFSARIEALDRDRCTSCGKKVNFIM